MSVRNWISSLSVAVCAATFWTIVLPLQTFLPNSQDFSYSVVVLIPWIVLMFLAVFAGVLFVCMIVRRYERISGCVLVSLVLITFCAYLEVGVLSIGLPQIDGTLEQFLKPSIRKYLDILVFVLLGSCTVIFYKKIYAHIPLFAISLCIMTLASLFDTPARMRNSFKQSPFDFGKVKQKCDVFASTVLSTNRNVIVLVLDATPADEAAQIVKSDKDLAKQLDGFVVYGNNIGMHEKTIRGVPALVTGQYLEKDDHPSDYLASFYGPESCLKDYLDEGYSMYVVPSLLDAYTNRRTSFSKIRNNPSSPVPFFRYTKETPYITLADVLFYRIMPYREKMAVISKAMMRGEKNHPIDNGGRSAVPTNGRRCPEERIFAQIRGGAVDGDLKTFQWYHTPGVHFPICYGEDGNQLEHPEENIEALRRYLHCVLRQVGSLMDHYRKMGVFDNTMVVVTTDHGIASYLVEKVPRSALLMVKPFGDRMPCDVSNLPTSHVKISTLLKRSARENLCREQVSSILYSKDRKVRVKQKTEEKWWYFGRMYETYDIFFDDFGTETNRVNLGVFEVL